MAIDDPRFSSVESDSEASFHVSEEHAPEAEIVIAQAGQAPAGAQGANPPIPTQVTPDQDNVVHLPAGVVIDQLRVQGSDLILVQADGSEIRVVNAALNIPTFVIDDIEIPREVLLAVLEENGIAVAAGPDGVVSVVGSGPQGSGGDFQDQQGNFGGAATEFLSLLTDAGNGDGGPDGDEEVLDPTPDRGVSFLSADSLTVLESNLPGGTAALPEGARASIGTLAFEALDGVSAILINGVTVTGAGQVIAGQFGTLTIVSVSDRQIEYVYDLSGPTTGDDNVDNFTVEIIDTDLDSNTTTIGVSIVDDVPAADNAPVEVTTDEGDIITLGSFGTTPFDGTGDGSTTGPFIAFLGLPATSEGSVAPVVSFGADGAAAGAGFGFTTDAIATLAGYGLLSNGEPLSFVVVDTALTGYTIIGYVDNGNGDYNFFADRTVLSFTLDRDRGDFAFRLFDQLDHVDDGNNDKNSALQTSSGPLNAIDFGAVIEATDGDGDTVALTGKLDVVVTDDIPVPFAEVVDYVRIDETFGPNSDNTFNPFVAALFNGGLLPAIADRGADADLPGPIYARYDIVDYLFMSQDGADDSATYGLRLQIDDADSGLFTTEGEPIILSLDGEGRIVGRVSGGVHDGEAAFAIHIDDFGRASIAQYLSLQHPDTTSRDEYISLSDKISVVLTVTDADGDTVTQILPIGADILTFDDDAPDASGQSENASVDEADLDDPIDWGSGDIIGNLIDALAGGSTSASGSIAGTVDFGADGAAADGGFVFTGDTGDLEGLGLTSNGDALAYETLDLGGESYVVGYVSDISSGGIGAIFNVLEDLLNGDTPSFGDILAALGAIASGGDFRLVFSLRTESDGDYTFRLFGALDHLQPDNDGSLTIDFSSLFAAEDGDGDRIDLPADTFTVTVGDDTPLAPTPDSRSVDEGNLTGGNDDTEAPSDLANGSRTATGNLNLAFGADGAAAAGVVLSAVGATWTPATATTGTLADDNGAWELVAAADGTYTFTLLQPLQHSDPASEDDIVIDIDVEVTDFDGDGEQSSFTITVDDDAPMLSNGVSNHQVDEDGIGGNVGDSYGSGDYATGAARDAATTASRSLNILWGADNLDDADGASGDTLLQDFPGGDGDRSVTFRIPATLNQLPDLTSGGNAVHYVFNDDGTMLIAHRGAAGTDFDLIDPADMVFRVSLSDDGNGSYSFELLGVLDHPDGGNEDNIALDFRIRATDSDGDRINQSFVVRVDDDAPVLTGQTSGATVDEADLSAPIDWGSGDFIGNLVAALSGGGTTAAPGQLDGTVSFGADGAAADGGFVFTGDTSSLESLGLTSGGAPVRYETVDLGGESYVLGFVSDIANLGAVFNVLEDLLNGETPNFFELFAAAAALASGGDFRLVFSLHTETSGDYTFRLFDPIDHAQPGNDGSLPIDFSSLFVAEDGDGDRIGLDDGTFVVTVEDDVPVAPDVSSIMDEDDTSHVVTLVDGDDFSFGADGAGSVTVDIGAAEITEEPTGVTLGLPGITFTGGDTITITPGTAFDALPVGESAILHIPYSVTDGDGDTTDGELLITITGTNDAPVIAATSDVTGSVVESGSIDGVTGAGAGGGLSHNFTITANLASLGTDADAAAFADVYADVLADVGGDAAAAIAVLWQYLDGQYPTTTGIQNHPINEAFARLGALYAGLLASGGVGPLTAVIAKYTADNNGSGAPDRMQSLHDNLLGNLRGSVLDGRFDGTLQDELMALVDAIDGVTDPATDALLARTAYSGNEIGTSGTHQTGAAYDAANGIVAKATGTIDASDVDLGAGQQLAFSGSGAGAYGSFAIDPDTGEWTYVLDQGAADALGEGDTETETFTVTVTDEHGAIDTATVTITITGTNDAPVIAGNQTGTVAEPGDIAGINEAGLTNPTGGVLPGLEPSAAQLLATAGIDLAVLGTDGTQLPGLYGQVLAALGDEAQAIALVWDYLDDAYGSVGPNKLPINEAFTRLGIEYAEYLLAGGAPLTEVVAKYVPDSNANGIPQRLQNLHDNLLGNLGDAALKQRYVDGSPKYLELKGLVQALSAEIDFTLRPYHEGGENDGAALTVARDFDIANGLVPAASGTMSASDVDTGDQLEWSDVTGSAGIYGSFAIDPDTGAWTYLLKPGAADALGEGDTETETFTVQVKDLTGATDTATITITITGTNDAPVIAATSDVTGSVVESGSIDGVTGAGAGGGLSHGFTITANLASLGTAADAAAFADVYADVLADVGGDAAAAIAVLWQYLDGQYPTTTGIQNHPINEAFARLGALYAGLLASGGVGPLTEVIAKYTADNNGSGAPDRMQSLHDNLLGNLRGSVLDGRFDGTLQDELMALVDAIDGVADPATDALLARTAYSGNEIGTSSTHQTGAAYDAANGIVAKATGTIDASDVDLGAGQQLAFSGSGAGAYGSFAIDPDTGEWTYVLDQGAADALGEGDTQTETFTVTVTDEHGATDTATVTITVTGTNDNTPPSATADTIDAVEDTPLTILGATLTGNDTDPDAFDTLTVSAVSNAIGGTVVLNGGDPIFTPDKNFSGIGGFDYEVSDGNGGTSTAHVTINVAPRADTPVLEVATATPSFDEFTVNQKIVGWQIEPQMTVLNDGRVLFTWYSQDSGVDGSSYGIAARIGAPQADGSMLWSDEFTVNQHVSGEQRNPQVTALGDGRLVFSWYSGDPAVDADPYGIAARIGTPQPDGSMLWSDEFTVSQRGDAAQYNPQVTALDDGRLVFTWYSNDSDVDGSNYGIAARIGTPQPDGSMTWNDEFTVNQKPAGSQLYPEVTALSDGRLVFTWQSLDPTVDGDNYGISARIGMPQPDGSMVWSDEFTVNQGGDSVQTFPQVAALDGGRLLFTWQSYDANVDGDLYGIAVRIGTPQPDGSMTWGDEFAVNQQTESSQGRPQVTVLADGRVVFTWYGYDPDVDGTPPGISARVGTPQPDGSIIWSDEFTVHQKMLGDQFEPQVAALADGRLIFTWRSNDPDVDGSAYGISGRIVDLDAAATTGNEDTTITLPEITAAVADADGSETLVLKLSGFPAGGSFSVGHAGTGADAGKWVIDDAGDIASLAATPLTFTPPANWNGDFTLTVDAVVTDEATLSTGVASDTHTFTQTIDVVVNAVNDAPFDVFLDRTDVDENKAAGTVVATLTAGDPDSGDSHSYMLVDNLGNAVTDGPFTISGDKLLANESFDHEAQSNYSVIIRTTDQDGSSFDKAFTITVNDVNDAPAITSSGNFVIDELTTAVGTVDAIDQDGGDLSWHIAGGDSALFDIDADTGALSFKVPPLYLNPQDSDGDNVYTLNVLVQDTGGSTDIKTITITVEDIDIAPTGITLDRTDVDENKPVGTAVATLGTVDADGDGPYTYQLVDSSGDPVAGGPFTISGDKLLANESFDHEAQSSYSIIVRTTDQGGSSFDKAFTITVNDMNDAPVITSASSFSVDEEVTSVTTLTATDQDNHALQWFIAGGADAGLFQIDADTGALRFTSPAAYNLGGDNQYDVIVAVQDSNFAITTQNVTVTVNNVNDAPVVDLNGSDDAGTGFAATFTEDGAQAAIVDADLTVSDVDATYLESATVTIIDLADGAAETLAVNTAGTSIAANYVNGVLMLTGSQSLADYQAVLRTLTYHNGSQSPTAGSRTIEVVVNDGQADSNVATSTVTVVSVNDPVTIEAVSPHASATEAADAAAQDIAPITGTLTVGDGDIGDTLTASVGTPVLAWSGGTLDPAVLAALTAALGTGKFNIQTGVQSTGSMLPLGYTWDPAAADLDFLAAGQTLTVTYDVSVSDGSSSSQVVPVTFTINGANDAPLAAHDNPAGNDPAFFMGENEGTKVFDILANDVLDRDATALNTVTPGAIGNFSTNFFGLDANDLLVTMTAGGIQVELLGSDWDKLTASSHISFTVNYSIQGDQPSDFSAAQLLIQVNGANDAPVLDTAGDIAFTVEANQGGPSGAAGMLVSEFLDVQGGVGRDNVTDADSFLAGMAITSAATGANGSWYWGFESGGTWYWNAVGAASETSALLLRPEYRLYYAPASGFAGEVDAALGFRAWDVSSGTPTTKVNTTNGGSTAFSQAIETVTVNVQIPNSAPVLGAITSPAAVVTEDDEVETENIAAISGTLSVTDANVGDPLSVQVVSTTATYNGQSLAGMGLGSIATAIATGTGVISFENGIVANGGATTIDWIWNPASFNPDSFDLRNGDTLRVEYTILINDGTDSSNTRTLVFEIKGTNDAPIVTHLDGDEVTFTEGSGPIRLDRVGGGFSAALVDEPDDAHFGGGGGVGNAGQLRVEITQNGVNGEDVLSIANNFPDSSGITLLGGNIRYGGSIIGSYSGGTNGSPLIINFSGSGQAAPWAVETLIRALRYQNTNMEDPSEASREITITLSDGDGGTSVSTVTVNVNGTNDDPTLTGLNDATFLENAVNAAPQLIDVDVSFGDADSANLAGGTLEVTGMLIGEDTVGIRHQGDGAGQIGLDGSNVTFGGVVIGTATFLLGTFRVEFDTDATPEAVDALIQNLTYANVSDTPTEIRTLTVTVTDGGGGTVSATTTITVTPELDVQPAVANHDTLSFTPTGWTLNPENGHIYKFFAGTYNWQQAFDAVDDEVGAAYLATLTSVAEHNFVDALIPSSYRVHLGGSDAAVEGEWRWVAGPEAGTLFWQGDATGSAQGGAYTAWLSGDPNNLSGHGTAEENYLAMNKDGEWIDVNGDTNSGLPISFGYVAEAGAPGTVYGVITEDAPYTFSADLLLANDTNALGGILSVGNAQGKSTEGATVSYNAGQITYNASGVAAFAALGAGETKTDTFTYTIDDGNGGTSTATVTVTVAGVNDAPVLASYIATVPAINEDAVDNAGQTIASLLGIRLTDADQSALEGVAIHSANSGNGTWQYKNALGTWVDFGAVSESDALLLAADSFVRFRPNGETGTSANFQFYGWDQTEGTLFGRDNVTVGNRRGTTAYSMQGAQANITVTSVPDAPTVTGLAFTSTGMSFTLTDPDSSGFVLAGSLNNVIGESIEAGYNDIDILPYPAEFSHASYYLLIGDGTYWNSGAWMLVSNDFGQSLTLPTGGQVYSYVVSYGFGGDDTLFGAGGDDFLFGGADNDTLTGGAGNDVLEGGEGDDTYNFSDGDGSDTVRDSGGSADRIVINHVGALEELDFERVDADGDSVLDDLVIRHNGETVTVIDQYNADGTALGSGAIEVVSFLTGSSYLGHALGTTAYSLDPQFAGARVLAGTSGADTLTGSGGPELIFGGGGADTLAGGGDNDLLVGGDGDDTINGGDGDDVLVGGAGINTLKGGSGSDIYVIDPTVAGIYQITEADSGVTHAMSPNDMLRFSTNGAAISQLSFLDNHYANTGGNLIFRVDHAEGRVDNQFDNPDVSGRYRVEFVHFEGGGSYLGYQLSENPYALTPFRLDLHGHTGSGGASINRRGSDGDGNDIIAGIDAGDLFFTENYVEVRYYGGGGDDIILGTDSGNPAGKVYVEELYGNAGRDLLVGNDGNDFLNGGEGEDTLAGGAGADTFVFDADALADAEAPLNVVDLIVDYTHGEDKIDLGSLLQSVLGGTPAADAGLVTLEQSVGNTSIMVDHDNNAGTDSIAVATLTGLHDTITILYNGTDETDVNFVP